MTKNIRLNIDDKTHERLRALCTHHGELSHLLRRGIRMVVREREDELRRLSDEAGGGESSG